MTTGSASPDVACGPGGHVAHLRQAYDVTGVDADPAMLEQARSKLPGIPLTEADMRSLHLNRRFDAVICLFSSIGYMTTTGELSNAVASMATHLNPRGVIIIDGRVLPENWKGTINTDIGVDITPSPMPGRDRCIGQRTSTATAATSTQPEQQTTRTLTTHAPHPTCRPEPPQRATQSLSGEAGLSAANDG